MYTAIYRDFRPDSFDRLVGQDHIVRILKSQIASGQTGHAYLFCGTRGTGKTTTARILAKALNCEAEDAASRPCCECSSCRSIREGSFMDVIEIDAASNNGVDNIRELRESVKYPPAVGRNKVYIIDEVHMLSSGAFNALLKTLEEPPEHVVFILATTEPQKLPATILSRCMRLDFRRVSEQVIIENMKMICRAKELEADPAALSLIAVNADGSVRDSLSILEQCISTGEKTISRDDVAELLGTAGEEAMIELTELVMKSNIQDALILLDQAINSGRDVKQFMKEWLAHFRNLLMAKYIKDPENTLNMSLENADRVKAQSLEISTDMLNRGIRELTGTISEARWSAQPRVLLEMCIVRLGVGQEAERATVFEYDGSRQPASGRPAPAGMPLQPAAAVRTSAPAKPAAPVQTDEPAREPDYITDRETGGADMSVQADSQTGHMVPGELSELWSAVLKQAVSKKTSLIRLETKATLELVDDRCFYVGVTDEVTKKLVKETGAAILEELMEQYCGRRLTLRLVKPKGMTLTKEADPAESVAEQMKQRFNMDIEIR